MTKIYIGGAGGGPSNNVIRSLRSWRPEDYIIGASSDPTDLLLADVQERHVVPLATDPAYAEVFLALLEQTRPDFLHVQNDYEVLAVSRLRESISALGIKTFLPSPEVIEILVDKYKSYQVWKQAGLRVPTTLLLNDQEDLLEAFEQFGGKVWIRATTGGGGYAALPSDNLEFARLWIDRFNGWGTFTAAEQLGPNSITWQSIWHEGELVVAQTRRRHAWGFGGRTLSGVTGVTLVAETCSFAEIDDLAQKAIRAADPNPHGIYGVDMTYSSDGLPNLTEINIGRFFTTIHFFTEAGLNMPASYVALGLGQEDPVIARGVNLLPDGLLWLRGMDVSPVLISRNDFEECLGVKIT